MKEAVYNWSVTEGRVTLANETVLGYEESLLFLLDQADCPATTYVHKSFAAKGLASHIKRRHEIPKEGKK